MHAHIRPGGGEAFLPPKSALESTRFTGWEDVPLAQEGKLDARRAGRWSLIFCTLSALSAFPHSPDHYCSCAAIC
eukprot:2813937-Rhodomonas_salina.2